MGVWLTREGLIGSAGPATVEVLAGDQTEAENRALVDQAILDAEAEILGYVVGRYPNIAQEANPTLATHTARVALWNLLSSKGYQPDTADESIKINYEGTIKFLTLVSTGKADLSPTGDDEEAEAASGDVTAVHPDRLLPPSLLDKY